MSKVKIQNSRQKIADILLKIGSVNINFKNQFTLTSGKKSPVYVDCRKLISLYINFMNAECSIQKEILALEVLKKRLLAENEILWDEINAVNRDLVSLKRIFEKNKETS